MNDLELDRLVASRERQAHLGHVVAAHNPNWALPVAAPDRLAQALPVQEALYRRQESDELVVVPLLELRRIAKLVVDFAPRAMGARLRQVFPVVLKGRFLLERQQMHGPEQVLAQMPDLLRIGYGPETCLGVVLHGEFCRSGVQSCEGSQSSQIASHTSPLPLQFPVKHVAKSNSRGLYGIYLRLISWK